MAFWDIFNGWKKKTSTMESVAVEKNIPSSEEEPAAGKKSEAYDEDFMAEHFEGFGDIWDAILHDDDSILPHIPMVLEQGKMFEDCKVVYKDKSLVALIQYPKVGDIRAGALIVGQPDSTNMELWSCFPLMQGIPNHLRIRKSHTWENGVEGVIAAERADGGPPISFYAPFYFRDFASFVSDSEHTVHLAALALRCEKAELQKFLVDKGCFYEMKLKEFLEEHTDKTEIDFPAPIVSMRGARILFPGTYACEWEYIFPVLAVEQTTLFEKNIYKLRVAFVGIDEEELFGYLYVPEHMLKGYVPQVGDDIQGILWMTGYLDNE